MVDRVHVKLADDPDGVEAAMAIRFRVFVDEQGVSPEEERDEADTTALHALVLRDGVAIGTGRLVRLPSGEGQIGRMAVDRDQRRAGVGSMILARLEDEARRMGLSQVILHAQTYVKAFYASHGYQEEGDVFMEAGIQHIQMRKSL